MDRPRDLPAQPLEVGREGGTELRLPALPGAPGAGPLSRRAVFYNPRMAFSRDLTVAVAATEARRRGGRLEAWDMLAATGVRGLRLLHEVPAVERVLATEGNPEAIEVLRENARLAAPGALESDCIDSREGPGGRTFDLVELDPYGTPAPFLPAALRALRPGGILGVTATDMAVLAGPERDACLHRYGGVPVRGYLSRESGLRLLLAHLSRTALEQGLVSSPLLSYIGGYYVRAFVRVRPSVGTDAGRDGGPSMAAVRKVPYPGYEGPDLGEPGAAGPLWMGPIHDPGYVRQLLPPSLPGAPEALERYLGLLRGEIEVDVPFYFETGRLSRDLRLPSPPPRKLILAKLQAQGFRAVRTHASASGWRTDAPREEVARIITGLHW